MGGWGLQYASDELEADKEVVMTAVKDSGSALQHASDELKADKEVVIATVKQDDVHFSMPLMISKLIRNHKCGRY